MNRVCKIVVLTGVLCGTAGLLAGAQLGSLLKGGVIVVAVDKFGPDINKAINKLTGERNVGPREATKVVPILSLGDSGYIGAVQVAGPEERVSKVQGVAQLEGRFKPPVIGGVRLRALIPVSTKTPSRRIERVDGVGVSAIIDFKL